VVIRLNMGGASEVAELRLVGLPEIDAFDNGWFVAGVPLLMTVRAGAPWGLLPPQATPDARVPPCAYTLTDDPGPDLEIPHGAGF
jgi:hypothetical protein